MDNQPNESLIHKDPDPLVRNMNKAVVLCVKVMAILMVVVIYWALADVIFHVFRQMNDSVNSFFNVESLISVLGAFLAVLIAIEIFMNVVFYLKEDAIHVPLVIATALTAAARKVIILDYLVSSAMDVLSLAAIILALGLTYWLITKK